MKLSKYSGFIFLLILLAIILYFPQMNFITMRETFQSLANSDKPLLYNSFKPNYQHNGVSADNYSDIWWNYPIFKVGSFKQITNNLRYFKNPDEGTCTRAEFCGAFYKDKPHKSNEIHPLGPVPGGNGLRVGYFRSKDDLIMGDSYSYVL